MSGGLVTVLPPRERFAPGEAGAVALLVRSLAEPGETVVGGPTTGQPFQDVRFLAAIDRGPWRSRWPRRLSSPFGVRFGPLRYAASVAAVLDTLRPTGVEIHNRPEIALALRRWFPDIPMRLVLHNDPLGMRKAGSARERETLARRVAVACVSGWLRDRYISKTSLSVSDVAVLPNCVDLGALPSLRAETDREKLILFAGRVVADKGVDAFVAACAEALPKLPGWRAEIIGADRFGPDSPETPFLSTLRMRAASAGVAMTGYKPHDVVLEAMASAAIVVAPSRWSEPFGLVALEAMACGAALIASDRGALPEVVGEAGILVDPDRPRVLGDAMVRLATDRALRADVAARGVARVANYDLARARARRVAAEMR